MIQKLMTSEDTGNSGSTTNSSVNVSPELLAKTALDCVLCGIPSEEALNVLIQLADKHNIEASLILKCCRFNIELSDSTAEAIHETYTREVIENNAVALLIYGCHLINSNDYKDVEGGRRILIHVGKNGLPHAYWNLALYYTQQKSPLASVYMEKAKEGGYDPAVKAFLYGEAITAVQEAQLSLRHANNVQYLQQDVRILKRRIEEQQAARQTETSNFASQILQWRNQYEEAEARLKALTAEAIREDYISGQDQNISNLENQLLETQIAKEDAEASKLKAERLADDLTRQNKYYITLLRKNGLLFSEPSSSSSSEGQTHV